MKALGEKMTISLPIEFVEHLTKFDDRERTLHPIVLPTYDQIAALWIMTMTTKRTTAVLKLNANSLPPLTPRIDTTFCFAIGKRCMNCLNNEAEFISNHPEKEYNPLFIDGRMS